MPIYEYVCRACGSETEIMQKMSDGPARKCPVCGKNTLTKQVSAAGFRLSGSGWYETDFKKSDDKKKNLVGDKTEAKPAEPAKAEVKPDKPAKSEAKPDKPAAKADAKAEKPAAKAKPAATGKKP